MPSLLHAADIIFVSVNTPTKTSGIGAGKAADLSYWESAARLIANACKGKAFKVVVEKSTVPVKTAEAISKVRYYLELVCGLPPDQQQNLGHSHHGAFCASLCQPGAQPYCLFVMCWCRSCVPMATQKCILRFSATLSSWQRAQLWMTSPSQTG
jgi:hypothetical protein